MENDAREQMLMLERAEAAPYVNYPPGPWWFPPAFGVLYGALVGLYVVRGDHEVLATVGLLVVVLLIAVVLRLVFRRYQAIPRLDLRKAPREIAAAYRAYFVGFAVIVVLVGLTWWLVGGLVAAGLTVVLVTGGLYWYERVYNRAAAALRARLA